MSDLGKYLKWMYTSATAALLVAQFFLNPGAANIVSTPVTWQIFAVTAGLAALCGHIAALSHANKLFLFGALAQHAGPLVRWSPFIALSLVVPTAGLLSATIGTIANGAYHIAFMGDLFHTGLVMNPVFWFISMAVSLPTMGMGLMLVKGSQGTLMGFASASRSTSAKLRVVPYNGGETWELHWEGERNGNASFAVELREALARAEAFGMMPRKIISDSHLWAQRTPETVENVFRRILGGNEVEIQVEKSRAIGGLSGAVINLFYRAKYAASRDSKPGAASRRVVVLFPDPEESPVPEGMS